MVYIYIYIYIYIYNDFFKKEEFKRKLAYENTIIQVR